jgi:hypothetical protein
MASIRRMPQQPIRGAPITGRRRLLIPLTRLLLVSGHIPAHFIDAPQILHCHGVTFEGKQRRDNEYKCRTNEAARNDRAYFHKNCQADYRLRKADTIR